MGSSDNDCRCRHELADVLGAGDENRTRTVSLGI
jgi:hypothetical protein